MLQALIGPVAGLLDKFVEDKDQKNALAHEIATMAERQAHESVMAQIEVNKAEAASASLFKGGWRPAVGWVCAMALFYHFILQPVLLFGVAVAVVVSRRRDRQPAVRRGAGDERGEGGGAHHRGHTATHRATAFLQARPS